MPTFFILVILLLSSTLSASEGADPAALAAFTHGNLSGTVTAVTANSLTITVTAAETKAQGEIAAADLPALIGSEVEVLLRNQPIANSPGVAPHVDDAAWLATVTRGDHVVLPCGASNHNSIRLRGTPAAVIKP